MTSQFLQPRLLAGYKGVWGTFYLVSPRNQLATQVNQLKPVKQSQWHCNLQLVTCQYRGSVFTQYVAAPILNQTHEGTPDIFVSWLVIISFYRSNTTLHTSNLLSASYLVRKAGHCFNLNFIACCTTQIRPDSHLISEPESSIGQEPMNM